MAGILGPCGNVPETLTAPDALAVGIAGATRVEARATADGSKSTLEIATAAGGPRGLTMLGRVAALTIAPDGATALAIVRVADKKGVTRESDLVRIDLVAAKVTGSVPLPVTARGIALSADGAGALVASKDDIRTFRLPQLTSGPLYRVPGDNLGVVAIGSSSRLVVVQPNRVGVVDRAESQSREGLTMTDVEAPAEPIRMLVSSAGEAGPVALAEAGHSYCVHVEEVADTELPRRAADVAPAAAAAASASAPPPPALPPPAAQPQPSSEPKPAVPAEPEPTTSAQAVPLPVAAPPPAPPPVPPPEAPPAQAPRPSPAPAAANDLPGSGAGIGGTVSGPARGEVAAIVFLGPDNLLREAARVVPDASGRFSIPGLPGGGYRVVASGKNGRVLLCDPPFGTIHVRNGASVGSLVIQVLRVE